MSARVFAGSLRLALRRDAGDPSFLLFSLVTQVSRHKPRKHPSAFVTVQDFATFTGISEETLAVFLV